MRPRFARLFESGTPVYGGWVIDASERAVEAYIQAGFDYVGFDCQHATLDETSAALLIRRFAGGPVAVIARSSENAVAPIGKLLDSGADAVIVPGVNTAEEARRVVAACTYPPIGVRSFGPIKSGMGTSPEEIQARALSLVMIETLAGVQNLDEIVEVEGLGGIYIGPADLSIGLGLPYASAFSSGQLNEIFLQVSAACRRRGLVLGAHATSAESAHRWISAGCDFVTVGSSVLLMNEAAATLNSALREPVPGRAPTIASGLYA